MSTWYITKDFHLNKELFPLNLNFFSNIFPHSGDEFVTLFSFISLMMKKNWSYESFWLTLFWYCEILRGGKFKLSPRERRQKQTIFANFGANF